MKIFRINLYLDTIDYFLSFLNSFNNSEKEIAKIIKNNSKKKYFQLSSQLRVSFLLLLKYLKKKYPKKKEIIFSAYNLEEMVEVAKNLGHKVILADIDCSTGSLNERGLIKKVNKNTLGIVYTNMFNDYNSALKIKRFCKKKKILFIEDNAIYFDNFKLLNKKKVFSGTLGDYTLYSFNIMKNISGLYGGGISCNDLNFFKFNMNIQSNFKNFPNFLYLKQNLIFLTLKIFSLNFFYKNLFFYIVKYAHFNKKNYLLNMFYPSLKFKKKKVFPKHYFSLIHNFSKKIVYLQLRNLKKRQKNHSSRKENNKYYLQSLSKMKLKQISLIKIIDLNYQNFLDFPILVENKKSLNNYLLKKGFEIKYLHYKNCSRTFNINYKLNKNSELFEKKIICLPSHSKINKSYIDNILYTINEFYSSHDQN